MNRTAPQAQPSRRYAPLQWRQQNQRDLHRQPQHPSRGKSGFPVPAEQSCRPSCSSSDRPRSYEEADRCADRTTRYQGLLSHLAEGSCLWRQTRPPKRHRRQAPHHPIRDASEIRALISAFYFPFSGLYFNGDFRASKRNAPSGRLTSLKT